MMKILMSFVILAHFIHARDLPKYLIPLKCPKDNNFQKCFVESANKAIPIVAKGDPDLHIPKLSPMEIPFLQLISTPNLQLNFTNIKVHGLDHLQMVDIRIYWDKNMYTTIFTSDNITIEGDYVARGQVMIMPIKGNGHFTMMMNGATFKATVVSGNIDRNGVKYFHLDDFKLDYNIKKLSFNFENLFEGNKELGDQLNKFLNDNWDLILTDFGPGISNTVSGIIRNIYQQVGEEVPVKYFFKE
ncbi:hypothetical protein WA026_005442 [Henosepilachna vigintioctopunctata]|uniref:Uncharacterized protein n=1 Tax=Henosepilachna vigintioctopunctata TaxID=420089 RepID=A0AAW1U1W9_9CUCU